LQYGLIATGVFLLGLRIGKGNALILAGPFALWTAVWLMSLGSSVTSPGRSERTRRRRERVAGRRSWRWLRWVVCLTLWATVVGAWRPELGKEQTTEGEIARDMAEAERLARDGEIEAAVRAYRAIDVPVRLPLRRAQKYHNLGALLLRLRRMPEAAEALELAVRFDPGDAEARFFLGRVCYERGEYLRAVKLLTRAKEQGVRQGTLDCLIREAREMASRSQERMH